MALLIAQLVVESATSIRTHQGLRRPTSAKKRPPVYCKMSTGSNPFQSEFQGIALITCFMCILLAETLKAHSQSTLLINRLGGSVKAHTRWQQRGYGLLL